MKVRFATAILAMALFAVAPAAEAARIKVADGEAYWDEDPGAIDPGPFWTSGQYKYDPNGYLDRYPRNAEQVRNMTVYADHAGKERCVFRKRLITTNWDYEHPYLRVCRR